MTKKRNFIIGAICGFMSIVVIVYIFLARFVLLIVNELYDPIGLLCGEVNTWLYAEEFEDPDLYWSFLPCETLDELKVLSYSSDSAKVYYVHDNYQTAYVAHFVKEDGKWVHGKYGYLCWADDHIAGNHDTPAAYWWFRRLKNKYEKPYEERITEQSPVMNSEE